MKKVVRLSESDLVRLVKRVIMEQDSKSVTVKDLKRDGYDVEIGDIPLSMHKDETLIDNEIKAVGEVDSAANFTLLQLLKQKGINPQNRRKGFSVKRELDNGNIEYKWITIQ
jgi:hypothetical protein